jgi:hypothetical protein
MPWTQFHDMHSGGGTKEPPYERIYIEAPEAEAKVIFYNRFGHNPERVSCTCCGEDYSTYESATFAQASGWERGCRALETPRDPTTRLYNRPDDPWFDEHYYLEPDEHEEAESRGYGISASFLSRGPYRTVEEYVTDPAVLVVPADEIKDSERAGDVPDAGFVWVGD